MSRITRLTVENLFKIKAVQVEPDGAVTIVAGDNAQGKSAVLNSIAFALTGEGGSQPVRLGQTSAYVLMETDDFVLKRTVNTAGRHVLELRDKDGKPVTSPQTKLNALFNATTYDPLTFTRLKPAEQSATLRRISGVDTTELDAEHTRIYDERTQAGRLLNAAKARRDAITRHADVPKDEISIIDLTTDLEDAETKNRENAEQRTLLTRADEMIQRRTGDRDIAGEKVVRLEAELKIARADLAKAEATLREGVEERNAQAAKVEKLENIPTAEIHKKMREAEGINAKVRDNKNWLKEHQDVSSLELKQSNFTAALEKIAKDKKDLLEKVTLPVEGLAYSDAGVTFNGVPFDQVSSAEQIRVSLAIACKLNPNLRVMLIRDGSLLDDNMMKIVADYAEANDAQVFLECVGHRDDATVIIEDGEVASRPAAEKKAGKKGKAAAGGDLKLNP